MPDLCFETMEGGEKVTEEAQEEMARYQSYFFSEPEIERKRKLKATLPTKGTRGPRNPPVPACTAKLRQSAYFNFKAIDKMLCLILGVGFAAFLANSDDVPLIDSDDFLPTLILHLDEGSPGYALMWFLMYGLPMRVVAMRDPLHRQWNDARLALSRSRHWWIVQLTSTCINLPFGPWDGSAWWERLVSQAQDFAVRSTQWSPLFMSLYSLICKDLGEGGPRQMDACNSEAGRAETLHGLGESGRATGERVQCDLA